MTIEPMATDAQLQGFERRSRPAIEHLRGCDWLISTVGMSPNTSCQAVVALRPKRVTLLHSEETKRCAEAIVATCESFLEDGKAAIELVEIERTTPESIARLARRPRAGVVVVDMTGGSKVMSAAAYHLADHIDARLVYSDSGAAPGPPTIERSTLRELALASTIRHERQMDEGLLWLARGQFGVAEERFSRIEFGELHERARLLRDLASLWNAWLRLDRAGAKSGLTSPSLGQPLPERTLNLAGDKRGALQHQVALAREFADGKDRGVLMGLAMAAEVHGESERSEFAALLWYRVTEYALEMRCLEDVPNLNLDDVDWKQLEEIHPDVTERFHSTGTHAWGERYERQCPRKLGLVHRLRLLHALKSDAIVGSNLTTKRVFGLVEARNKSILAHGQESVEATLVGRLRSCALEAIEVSGVEVPGPMRAANFMQSCSIREIASAIAQRPVPPLEPAR